MKLPKRYMGKILFGFSVFLMLDAFLSFFIGESYMYFGLDYLPVWYSNYIMELYKSPQPLLLLSMAVEFVVGLGLFFLSQRSSRHDH